MFGNSLSSGRPTWAVFADNLTDTSTAGVITDETLLPTVDDFKYSMATDNRWHQHVLTYNGKNSPLPTLQYFIDGNEMVGNSRLENGNYPNAWLRLAVGIPPIINLSSGHNKITFTAAFFL